MSRRRLVRVARRAPKEVEEACGERVRLLLGTPGMYS
jgi:hypothetical protein